jgi:hypothetical protein
MPFAESLNPAPAVSGLGAFLDSERGGGAAGMAAIAAAREADPLPCLSSNNSIETRAALTPYQRKNAHSINENLNACIELFGIEKIGFLTLTFPKSLSLKEANRRFNSLVSNVLNEMFVHWVCVREFTKSGRPHFHLVVVCKGDVLTGFNWSNYTEMLFMSSSERRRRKFKAEIRKLSRSLDPSPELRSMWTELRRVLPLYQFGRAELIPIRKNAAALARYVGGYIRKSMDFRPVEAKGARLITYSKNFPRRVVGHAWAFNTAGSALHRKKVEVFAKRHRIKDLTHMKERFGPRWAWWLRDLIRTINLAPYLRGDDLHAYLREGSPDCLAFAELLESGKSMFALHLRRPELPEVDGKPLDRPPIEMRGVFSFHQGNWSLSPDEIDAARSARSPVERSARSVPGYLTGKTEEALGAARAALVAPVRDWKTRDLARASEQAKRSAFRAKNYKLLHFKS